jgi:hypothetical protein
MEKMMAKHIISSPGGTQEIECLKGGDSKSENCPQCNKEKEKMIKTWILSHESYCLICDMKPKCYICLRGKCEEWLKNKDFMESYGTFRGCPKLTLNNYCGDFVCKYKFVGWWNSNWKSRLAEIKSGAIQKLLEDRRKRREARSEKRNKRKR